jgi:hypothetical protein
MANEEQWLNRIVDDSAAAGEREAAVAALKGLFSREVYAQLCGSRTERFGCSCSNGSFLLTA